MSSSRRISTLAQISDSRAYLEIGVSRGATFLHVDFPRKTAVDPVFQFPFEQYRKEGVAFFQTTSDDFFAELNRRKSEGVYAGLDVPEVWDIIFIDGLHTFEQSFRDFENSLAWAHPRTVWLLDDTVPGDPYSSLPDANLCMKYRELAGLSTKGWHGDVFKTVFAIHDRYPDFSYCTIMDEENPQTLVWRAEKRPRKPVFASLEEIARLDYFGMLRHAALMSPVSWEEALSYLGKTLVPRYEDPNAFEKLFYSSPVCLGMLKIFKQMRQEIRSLEEALQRREQASRP